MYLAKINKNKRCPISPTSSSSSPHIVISYYFIALANVIKDE
jgi:hypothetical protein